MNALLRFAFVLSMLAGSALAAPPAPAESGDYAGSITVISYDDGLTVKSSQRIKAHYRVVSNTASTLILLYAPVPRLNAASNQPVSDFITLQVDANGTGTGQYRASDNQVHYVTVAMTSRGIFLSSTSSTSSTSNCSYDVALRRLDP